MTELTSPNDLQKKINRVITKYSSPPCFKTSMNYLLTDCLCVFFVIVGTILLQEYMNPYILFLVYSATMGTICTGLWVLAHECGHGAFGRTRLQNDVVGYVLHSFLLVPYFSWRDSHHKHHKYCNHLTLGEVFVPSLKEELTLNVKLHHFLGDDVFSIYMVFTYLLFSWPVYLFTNVKGGRTQSDLKTKINPNKWKDHFHSGSQVMKKSWKIELSTIGCLTTIYLLTSSLGWASLFWYVGPYLVMNMWIIIYTWLHHTHPNIPHYGTDSFTFLKGALSTVDRPYPKIIDELHHHIGSTHVMHHLNYSIPHYRGEKCTEELRDVLGKYYNYDSTPIVKALFETARKCHYIHDITGIQTYKQLLS
tara:strand:+ start:291 stop:1379 length:1089 start_codon:yes stop_codon:yes gene_type:complete